MMIFLFEKVFKMHYIGLKRLNWVKNAYFEERCDDDGGDESDKNIEARDDGSRA